VTINNGEATLSLSSQPSGVYFLQVKTKNGMAVRKIVKK